MYDVFFDRTINRNDLLEYIGCHYKGPRVVLAGAGGIYILLVLTIHDKLMLY
jgi:hypothetical protein